MALPAPKPPSLLARVWFPVALLVLLFLAIPGFVLFLLHLFQGEGAVNAWLQERVQLSYHLTLPWKAGLLLLLLPVALILLYFLKLKRKPLRVPSTFLWRKSIEDLHVNSLFQWLRDNVLLLLQLLILLALLYAVLAPRLHGNASKINRYILIVDNSASMAATDVLPSRLHAAKEETLKEIDARNDTDLGMIIVFNSSAQTLQPFTNDRGLLRQKIAGIEQTQRPTRINEALRLAESLANLLRSTDDVASRPADVEPGKERSYDQPEGYPTEVHLFSDGRFPDVPEFSLGNLTMNFHAAGKVDTVFDTKAQRTVLEPSPESTDNVALVGFTAMCGVPRSRRDVEAAPVENSEARKLHVSIGVRNFRLESIKARVQLEATVDGKYVWGDTRNMELPARVKDSSTDKTADEALRDLPGEGLAQFVLAAPDDDAQMILHAKLVDHKDRFSLDDEAWLAVGILRKARVLMVGGNRFLDAFFDDDAVQKVATLTRLTPADLATDAYQQPAREGRFDVVIFDRCGPDKAENLPRANTFFIGQPPPPWQWAAEDRVEYPHIRGWQREHPLLQELTALYEIGVSEAFKMKDLPPRTPRLIETDRDMAVLLSFQREAFTDLVLTFPLLNDKNELVTNWPLQPSFPVFLRNVLRVLGNFSDVTGEERIQPGQVKSLRPDVNMDRLTVLDPAGKEHNVERGKRADFNFGATDRLGVYNVHWSNGAQRSFSVNLLDRDESNIEPRALIQIGAQLIEAGQERGQPRELWPWLVLAALALLLAEWYIYNRRVYI